MPEYSHPVQIILPASGVAVAESVHSSSFTMEMRTDPFNKLLMIVRGRTRLYVGSDPTLVIGPGNVAPVPADSRHRLEDSEPSTVIVLALATPHILSVDARAAVWQRLVSAGPQSLDHGTLSRVSTRFRTILNLQRAADYPTDCAVLLVRSFADEILADIAANNPGHADLSSQERVRMLLDQIAEEPFHEWTGELAASRSGLSVRRFADLARQLTGRPFQKWLSRLRARYSALLISRDGYSVSAAAFAAGFSSMATFYRVFNRELGCAPGQLDGSVHLPAVLPETEKEEPV